MIVQKLPRFSYAKKKTILQKITEEETKEVHQNHLIKYSRDGGLPS